MKLSENILPTGYERRANGDLAYNDGKLKICAYETIGKRSAQEDCLTINEVPHFERLTDKEQRHVLVQTYDKINDKLRSKSVADFISATNTGTTALTCFSYITKKEDKTIVTIVSANLADSSAYYFIRTKTNGKIRRCARINKNLHKPNDRSEEMRINRAGGTVSFNRVDGMLAVARAFGDFSLSNKVIHTPDIDILSIELNHDEELLLIAACDGLTENKLVEDGSEAKFISKTGVTDAEPGSEILALKIFIEQECEKLDFAHLPTALKNWAIKTNFSRDNITVIVQSIDADLQEPISQHAIMLAVFDGHNGDNVARFVKDIFYDILKQEINNRLKPSPQVRNATMRIKPLYSPSAESDEEANADSQAACNDTESDAEPLIPPQLSKDDSASDNGPPIPPKSNRVVIQQEPINDVSSVAEIKENIWLTKEVITKIKSDYETKFNSKLFKRTSVESKQLLDDLKDSDSLEVNQQKINAYLANHKYKNKRLYEILIENRVHAQMAFAIKNKKLEMIAVQVERPWLNNSMIDDICFLIDRRYTQSRGFKFFGYTSNNSFILLELLRKPTHSIEDKEGKKHEIEKYLANNEDADTRLYKIITDLFDKLHKVHYEAVYQYSVKAPGV